MQGGIPIYGPAGILDSLNEYRVEGDMFSSARTEIIPKFDDWNMTHLAARSVQR